MPNSIPERIDAITNVLQRLAGDIEVIRAGSEALAAALPAGCEIHYRLLKEQAAALERISIGMGMVQATAEGLGRHLKSCRNPSHPSSTKQELP